MIYVLGIVSIMFHYNCRKGLECIDLKCKCAIAFKASVLIDGACYLKADSGKQGFRVSDHLRSFETYTFFCA